MTNVTSLLSLVEKKSSGRTRDKVQSKVTRRAKGCLRRRGTSSTYDIFLLSMTNRVAQIGATHATHANNRQVREKLVSNESSPHLFGGKCAHSSSRIVRQRTKGSIRYFSSGSQRTRGKVALSIVTGRKVRSLGCIFDNRDCNGNRDGNRPG